MLPLLSHSLAESGGLGHPLPSVSCTVYLGMQTDSHVFSGQCECRYLPFKLAIDLAIDVIRKFVLKTMGKEPQTICPPACRIIMHSPGRVKLEDEDPSSSSCSRGHCQLEVEYHGNRRNENSDLRRAKATT